jgi:hypothetical protein
MIGEEGEETESGPPAMHTHTHTHTQRNAHTHTHTDRERTTRNARQGSCDRDTLPDSAALHSLQSALVHMYVSSPMHVCMPRIYMCM